MNANLSRSQVVRVVALIDLVEDWHASFFASNRGLLTENNMSNGRIVSHNLFAPTSQVQLNLFGKRDFCITQICKDILQGQKSQ